MESIDALVKQKFVFGATCLQINNPLLQAVKKFDFCVMDEASQICEQLVLGPLSFCTRFVMIGDYYQLNPLVKSSIADRKGMGISLFERLCKKHP
jgi:DNA replication ATP-dependent helicase Dna2